MTHADSACKTWRYAGANAKVADILNVSVAQAEENITELRVLDLGAGHGLMGEPLCKYGVSRMVAFNIKDTFLHQGDDSGFSRMIRELIFSGYLDLYHLERYRHRLSIEEPPLCYFAVTAKEVADVPVEWMDRFMD